jgi:hexosaminidase
MLRRIAGSNDIAALRTLADVVEPVKDYTREVLHQADPATQFTPLNRLIDAARPESETAREFRLLVDSFLAQPSPDAAATIGAELTSWKENDAKLQPQIAQSFLLKEIAPLSTELAQLSDIGLRALDSLEQKQAVDAAWRAQSLQTIANDSKPQADLLIMIAPAVQRLVEATH